MGGGVECDGLVRGVGLGEAFYDGVSPETSRAGTAVEEEERMVEGAGRLMLLSSEAEEMG